MKFFSFKHPLFICLVCLGIIFSVPQNTATSVRTLLFKNFTYIWNPVSLWKKDFKIDPKLLELQQDDITEFSAENNEVIKQQQLEKNVSESTLHKNQIKHSVKNTINLQNPLIANDDCRRFEKLIWSQLRSTPAQVIWRDPSMWSSKIQALVYPLEDSQKQSYIEKNSPVIFGNALIGIVESVSDNLVSIRLITDSELRVSVKAIRGSIQNIILANAIQNVETLLNLRTDLEQSADLIDLLSIIKDSIPQGKASWYLAKGEISGYSTPIWRNPSGKLKGKGFNYDFSDSEGPRRDLHTGKSEGAPTVSIIKKNDILITSGLDSLFPEGLYVGQVSKVKPLKKGKWSYELEAQALAGDLQNLNIVYILPPVKKADLQIQELKPWQR